jgi:hypothetical protein
VKKKLPELDFQAIRLTTLSERHSKVNLKDFVKPMAAGASFAQFVKSLPDILAGSELKIAAWAMAEAFKNDRTIMLAMGGHPIKVGLGPLIITLLERGILSSISANGSVMVHDLEVALVGSTSEDVAQGLAKGDFGVTEETGRIINRAAAEAARTGLGLGGSLGTILNDIKPPCLQASVLAAAARLGVPCTIHVALGSDVYHIHPDFDAAAMGRASGDDFHTFCRLMATMEGGVFLNLGSAVIMPEVFLKGLTLVRNQGYAAEHLTTINMDFIRQYRPTVNVVERPTRQSGCGINLVGHHEIMFPLLMNIVLEYIEN